MRSERSHSPVRQSFIFAAYYAILVVFLAASFFPQYRLWGVNWWAYFPGYVPFVLFAIGAVAPIVIRLVLRRGGSDVGDARAPADKSGKYFIVVFCLTMAYGFAFYLLRARTHLFGDGYQILSVLASDNPFVKPTERGEALVHLGVKSLIGGDAETSALLSYQIVSISAGVLFLIAVALVSKWSFDRTINRILFWLGLASSGYMLLFFGHVENYSLFVLSVAVYSLMGLLVAKGRINRWLILPVVALAIFFHVLGVTLIPSAIYLLVANSRVGDFLSKLSHKTKLLTGAITVVILVSFFYHFYSTDYFFRFAFVPLFENRFTVEGYTLFSSKHLLDYLNLLILLLPSLPLVAVTLFFLPLRKIFKQMAYRYLLILLVSTLGAVFILDPKLGMPRDWDLFSFSGMPLAVFCYYLVLLESRSIQSYLMVPALSIMLGLLSLFPRTVSQVIPEISVEHFKNHCKMDKVKNRNARRVLIDFYKEAGEEEMARLEMQQIHADFPERQLLDSAIVLIDAGYPLEAIPLLRLVLEVQPLSPNAWWHLSKCYRLMEDNESALKCLKLANGINPHNAVFVNDLGIAYLFVGEYQRAEKALKESISLDSTLSEPLFNLVYLYAVRKYWEKYYEYFSKLSVRPDSPVEDPKALGDFHLSRRDYKRAAEAYRVAVQKGLDSMYVKQLMEKYPQLRQ